MPSGAVAARRRPILTYTSNNINLYVPIISVRSKKRDFRNVLESYWEVFSTERGRGRP